MENLEKENLTINKKEKCSCLVGNSSEREINNVNNIKIK